MHPAGATAVLEIIPVILDTAEGYAAEPMDLQNILSAGRGSYDINIGLFAHADAIAG